MEDGQFRANRTETNASLEWGGIALQCRFLLRFSSLDHFHDFA
jgi:hypothetical protein